jgi:hypothetical protein
LHTSTIPACENGGESDAVAVLRADSLHAGGSPVAVARNRCLLNGTAGSNPSRSSGVFRSIADLQAAINRYLKEHNDDPKPLVWTKPANVILAKLARLPVPSG